MYGSVGREMAKIRAAALLAEAGPRPGRSRRRWRRAVGNGLIDVGSHLAGTQVVWLEMDPRGTSR